ncbi:MAG: hypothetical protein AAFY88_22740, partial [Acidobacteriota bacterium]
MEAGGAGLGGGVEGEPQVAVVLRLAEDGALAVSAKCTTSNKGTPVTLTVSADASASVANNASGA